VPSQRAKVLGESGGTTRRRRITNAKTHPGGRPDRGLRVCCCGGAAGAASADVTATHRVSSGRPPQRYTCRLPTFHRGRLCCAPLILRVGMHTRERELGWQSARSVSVRRERSAIRRRSAIHVPAASIRVCGMSCEPWRMIRNPANGGYAYLTQACTGKCCRHWERQRPQARSLFFRTGRRPPAPPAGGPATCGADPWARWAAAPHARPPAPLLHARPGLAAAAQGHSPRR
jgi:hypothetical protein